jgi:hypothetical protein
MTPDIQSLMRLAAERGHRTHAGHHCHNLSALIQVDPENDNQARRRLAILAVETDGLAKAMASHGPAGASDGGAQS